MKEREGQEGMEFVEVVEEKEVEEGAGFVEEVVEGKGVEQRAETIPKEEEEEVDIEDLERMDYMHAVQENSLAPKTDLEAKSLVSVLAARVEVDH